MHHSHNFFQQFTAWMVRNRKSNVVKASQPEFLSLVAIGCLMLASAILPLSIEGEYRYERDAITLEETEVINDDMRGVDAACMAIPWLISIVSYMHCIVWLTYSNDIPYLPGCCVLNN